MTPGQPGVDQHQGGATSFAQLAGVAHRSEPLQVGQRPCDVDALPAGDGRSLGHGAVDRSLLRCYGSHVTPSEAASLIILLTTAFPDGMRFLSDQQAEASRHLMRACLLDLDYAPARDAVMRGVASVWRRWPSIADVRALAVQQVDGRVTAGGEAWGSVRRAINGAGVHRVPGVDFHFRDPVVARCVNALGWAELCNSETATADRARFVELYDKLAAERTSDQTAGQIAPLPRKPEIEACEPRRLGDVVAGLLSQGTDE